MSDVTPSWFRQKILAWFAKHGRHDLPWKANTDPYPIWVSEIMLQQTQVDTVIPYFERFLKAFPTLANLADAPLDAVLALWSGLGYYARGRNLHAAAQILQQQYQGAFPKDVDTLMSLPGIGRSTAGAILAQAFSYPAPILDGNVKRVLSRFHAVDSPKGSKDFESTLWALAEKYTPKKNVAEYTQAMMDLGATCCTRSKPLCSGCPLMTRCAAFHKGTPTAFPVPKKAKTPPKRSIFMLIVHSQQGQLLFWQRPPKGIWGGLYSFPEFTEHRDLNQFAQNYHAEDSKMVPLPALKHQFTHFTLTILPMLLTIKRAKKCRHYLWVKKEEAMSLALPRPIQKLLAHVA